MIWFDSSVVFVAGFRALFWLGSMPLKPTNKQAKMFLSTSRCVWSARFPFSLSTHDYEPDYFPVVYWSIVLFCHDQFCFEGMEESGSLGLDDLIAERKDTFFKVQYISSVLCLSVCFSASLSVCLPFCYLCRMLPKPWVSITSLFTCVTWLSFPLLFCWPGCGLCVHFWQLLAW